jgi:hypothetical protein
MTLNLPDFFGKTSIGKSEGIGTSPQNSNLGTARPIGLHSLRAIQQKNIRMFERSSTED